MPRIFIVDDSISVRKALEITFKRHSLESVSAVSAEAALELLHDSGARFDLMMADVIMPGMSGLELCASLRQQERFARMPIVLMSGNIDEEMKMQAKEVGANGVLRKPFSPDELIPMVEHLLKAQAELDAATQPAAAPQHHEVPPTVTAPLEAPAAAEVARPAAAVAVTSPTQEHVAAQHDQHHPEPVHAPAVPEHVPSPAPAIHTTTPVAPTVAAAAPAPQPHPPVPSHPTLRPDPIDEVKRVVQQYRSLPAVEDVMVLDPEFRLIYHSGTTLAGQLPSYAKYFSTTAQIIGQQLLNDEVQTVTLQYRGRSVIYHILHDYSIVVLHRNLPATH